jgi:uncharacterized membrane protein YdbT with pleckstrin-like domain
MYIKILKERQFKGRKQKRKFESKNFPMNTFNAQISKLAYSLGLCSLGGLFLFAGILTRDGFAACFAGGLIIILLGAFHAWLVSLSHRLTINAKAIDYRLGILSKDLTSLALRKIESIELQQGLAGRIFNYGRLRFHGTGGGNEWSPWIKNPSVFKAEVERRAEALQALTGIK